VVANDAVEERVATAENGQPTASYLTLDPMRGQIGPLGLGEFGAVDTAYRNSEGVPRRPPK
jgi:hypothetical protein